MSLNNDRQRGGRSAEGTGWRNFEKSNKNIFKNNKKESIVRVCQLRMIVWLVETSPPVPYADRPRLSAAPYPIVRREQPVSGAPDQALTSNAATTRRSSCTRMLKVRQAAPRSIGSSAIPREANA